MAFPILKINLVLTTAAFFLATTALLTYYSPSAGKNNEDDDDDSDSDNDYYNNNNTNTAYTPPSTPTHSTHSSITDLTDDHIVDLLWREWNAQARCALLLVERQILSDQFSPSSSSPLSSPLRSILSLPIPRAAEIMMTNPATTTTTTNTNTNTNTTNSITSMTTNQRAKMALESDPELRETLEELAARTHTIPGLRRSAVPEGVDWKELFMLDEDPVPIAKKAAEAGVARRGRTKEGGEKDEGSRVVDGDRKIEGGMEMIDLGLLLDVCFHGLLD